MSHPLMRRAKGIEDERCPSWRPKSSTLRGVGRQSPQLRAASASLPTWSELADPRSFPADASRDLKQIDPDHGGSRRESLAYPLVQRCPNAESGADVPAYVVLPSALTGTKAPIVVLLGRRFPMIGAHKVLAAYRCLAARLVTGYLIRRMTGRSGLRPGITAAAGSPSPVSWAVGGWRCCRQA